MLTLKVDDLSPLELQNYLQYAIAPRPIALASTIDAEGNVNLSPFSFFNMFSTNPPICIISPSRRVRDNTTKHTLENLQQVPQLVINIVNYAMVQQTSLSSVEYAQGVNEFNKAGFTELPSLLVKPPRVAESPVQLECVVNDIIGLGDGPGAGNLIIAQIKLIHVDNAVIGGDGKIDPFKMDQVARLGGDWYCRVTKDSLFTVAKPNRDIGVGVDALPYHVRNSSVLTGNDLGQLGNLAALPDDDAVESFANCDEIKEILDATIGDSHTRELHLHLKAKSLISEGRLDDALKVLFID